MKRSRSSFEQSSNSDNNKHNDIQLLLHGANGAIPYMTPMLLERHFPPPQPNLLLGIAVKDTCLIPFYPNKESSKPKGYEFATFEKDAYLKEYPHVLVPSFDMHQDAVDQKGGVVQATDKGVSVWTLQGRQFLSNESYVALTNTTENNNSDSTTAAAAPAVVSLYDCFEAPKIIKSSSSTTDVIPQRMRIKQEKREQQATERTQRWLEELIHIPPKNNTMWAPVGFGIKFPQQKLIHDAISGYAIVGWEYLSDKKQFVSELNSLSLSSKEKNTMAVLSATSFESVLECIKYGVNVVGTNLVTQWSKDHKAFCLDWKSPIDKTTTTTKKKYILDLADTIYEKDDSSLVENCVCLTCQNHTRAYIHHLIRANELLAQILLMAHNLHHFLQFFKAATQARNDGELESFVERCSQ